MEKNKERTERELKSQHPLLSRIKPWLKRQLKRADAERASQHTWDAHVKAIGKNKLVINTCVSQVISLFIRILSRDINDKITVYL